MNRVEKGGLSLAISALALFMLGLHMGDWGVVLWGLMLMGVGLVIFGREGGDHDLSV